MYLLIDQPVHRLSQGSRFLLWAMRSWATAASAGTGPFAALEPAFEGMGVATALPAFNTVMAMLDSDGLEKLGLAPIGSTRIGEDEAILLTLWSASLDPANHGRRDGTLALLVAEEAVSPIACALDEATPILAEIGLAPAGIATHDNQEAGR
jgi:hypothetical protein